MTMTLVSTVTVGAGGAASIQWTGIPATGTDLLLVVSLRDNASTNGAAQVTLNSDTTDANYAQIYLNGNGSSPATASANSRYLVSVNSSAYTASTFSNSSLYIPNYTSTAAKSMSVDGVSENNSTTAFQIIRAVKWSGTSAITSLSLSGLTFAQYSTASLYTITKGSGGATVS